MQRALRMARIRRVAVKPTANAANAAAASASFACFALLRTGAKREPLSPGPASSESGADARGSALGLDFGSSSRRGASGRARTPGIRVGRFLLLAITRAGDPASNQAQPAHRISHQASVKHQ